MALKNQITEEEFDTPRGLDTTSPLPTMKPGFVRQARNANLGLAGGYVKRSGYTSQLSSAYGSRDITAGIEYRPSTGTNQTVVFGTTGSGSGGRYGKIVAGAVTNISTGLTGAARPSFVQFDTLLFFYNGTTDGQLYDGSGTRQIGITAPVAAPGFTSQSTAGDLTPLGVYLSAYTYYNSTTGAESSPSPVSDEVTLTGANDEITWSVTAGDAATADKIRFYRTVANGNVLFLDQEVAVASTSVSSTVADAGLGDQIEFDNSRIFDFTSSPNFPTIVENRVFVKSASNEIRFSKIGQSGPMPESFQANAFVPTTGEFGEYDKIVGNNKVGQTPIVLKEKSIGRLDPVGTQDITNAADPVQYIYREISTTVGAVHHAAAAQVLGELVFLSKDNIYATDGLRVRPIADQIQASIRALGFTETQVTQVSAHNDTENRRIYISCFATGASANPSIILVGDYQFYPDFRWTTYEPGPVSATHPGISPGCFFQVTNTSTGKQDVWFGNTALNGKAYRMNDGTNDDSLGISFRVASRPYFFSSPLKVKLAKLIDLQAKGSGSNYNLTIGSIFDLSNGDEDFRSFELAATLSLYDIAIYDTDVYSDDVVQTLQYSAHRKCKYWQAVFQQTEADAPVELFAWEMQAAGFDKDQT